MYYLTPIKFALLITATAFIISCDGGSSTGTSPASAPTADTSTASSASSSPPPDSHDPPPASHNPPPDIHVLGFSQSAVGAAAAACITADAAGGCIESQLFQTLTRPTLTHNGTDPVTLIFIYRTTLPSVASDYYGHNGRVFGLSYTSAVNATADNAVINIDPSKHIETGPTEDAPDTPYSASIEYQVTPQDTNPIYIQFPHALNNPGVITISYTAPPSPPTGNFAPDSLTSATYLFEHAAGGNGLFIIRVQHRFTAGGKIRGYTSTSPDASLGAGEERQFVYTKTSSTVGTLVIRDDGTAGAERGTLTLTYESAFAGSYDYLAVSGGRAAGTFCVDSTTGMARDGVCDTE